MNPRYLKIFIVILFLLSVGLIVFLLFHDLAWQGRLTVETDFTRFTPYFTILKPQDRVVIQQVVYIQAEPVYFDLYLPRDFAAANLEIEYKNEFNYPIKIGAQMGTDWELKDLNSELPVQSNGFTIKHVEFDLSNKSISHGKLRFIISLPGLADPTQGVYLKILKIKLDRPTIMQEGLINNLFNYFKYVKNQFYK